MTFKEQTVEYLVQSERMKSFASMRGGLYKWVIPEIGKLPLSDVNNMTVKPIRKMVAAGLSPRTVNKYVEYVRLVVASLVDNNTGEPIFERKWNRKVMGLPKVRKKETKASRTNRRDCECSHQQSRLGKGTCSVRLVGCDGPVNQ